MKKRPVPAEYNKPEYKETNELREALKSLSGHKYVLDCGHKVTFNHYLGNDVTIINGKELKIICSLCGH